MTRPEDDIAPKRVARVSIMFRTEEPCGCVNLRWVWLFGHAYSPCWAMCADHVGEMLEEMRATLKGRQK